MLADHRARPPFREPVSCISSRLHDKLAVPGDFLERIGLAFRVGEQPLEVAVFVIDVRPVI